MHSYVYSIFGYIRTLYIQYKNLSCQIATHLKFTVARLHCHGLTIIARHFKTLRLL